MATKNETTLKLNADISGLKQGIADANRQIKLANSAFKSAVSAMDDWNKTAEGLTKKIEQLESVHDSEKKKLELLNKQYELTANALGENSREAENLKIKIYEQQSVINRTERELNGYRQQLDNVVNSTQEADNAAEDSISAYQSLTEKIAQQERDLKNLKDQYKDYVINGQEASTEAQDLAQQISELSRELDDNRQQVENANRAVGDLTNGLTDNVGAYDTLSQKVSQQEQDLRRLKDEYKNYVINGQEATDEAQNLAREISDLSRELNENRQRMQSADNAADGLAESLEDAGEAGENSVGGIDSLKVAFGNLISAGIQMAISAIKDFAKETIEVGKTFEKSMSNVAALSGATGKDLEMLSETAKAFGSTTQYSASEAADALGYMALAGWDANQSADALGGVLNLAAASGMDLAKASDMVTDYMSAFSMQAEDSAYFADILAYAQANANTTAEGLGEAYKNSAANLNAAGQDIETVTALLSEMANQGLKGSEAGTALSAMMRDITNKMKDGAIAIGNTTVQVMDAEGNYRDLTDILADVEKATAGLGDAEKAAALSSTFTAHSIKGLNLILNAGVDKAAAFEEELRNSSGAAEEMAKIMNDNLGGDMTALNSKLEGVQITLYEKLEPALRAGVEVLSKLLDGLSWFIDHGQQVVGAIIPIATAIGTFLIYINKTAIVTAFTTAITAVKTAFLGLNAVMAANPIGLVIAAIAALVAAFIYFWNTSEDFRNFWINLWDIIVEKVSGIAEKIAGFFKGLWDNIIEGAKSVGDFFTELWTGISEFFFGIWESISEAANATWKKIKEFFAPAAEWFSKLFSSIWESFSSVIKVIIGLAKGCWNIIKRVYEVVSGWFKKNIIEPVTKFFSDMWDKISAKAETAWNFIKDVFGKVVKWFDDKVITPVSNFFGDMWDKFKAGASSAWEGIKSVFGVVADWFEEKFSTAWQKVKDVFSTGGKIFDGIKEGITSTFKIIVNSIIRGINKVISIPFNAINKMLNKIRSIEILDIKPFENLWSQDPLSIPQIPELAKGGVLKKGQTGYLEGNGAEAVVPLEKNTEWIKRVAGEMAQELNSKLNEVVNNYNFYQTNNSPKALSRLDIYRQTKNQISMLKGV